MDIPRKPLQFVLYCVQPYRLRVLLFFGLSGIGTTCWILSPYVISRLVDYLPAASGFDARLWSFIGLFALLRFADEWFWRLSDIVMRSAMPQIVNMARERLFRRVMKHDYRFFVSGSSGQFGHWINEASRIVGDVIESAAWSLWPLLLQFVISFGLLLTVGWSVAAIFLAWIVLLVLFLIKSGRRYAILSAKHAEALSGASGMVVDALANYLAVRTFAASKHEDQAVSGANRQIVKARRRSWRHAIGMHAVKGNSAALVSSICLVLTIWLYVQGRASLGDILLLITYITTLSQQVWELGWQMDSYFRNYGEMKNILDGLLDVRNSPTFAEKAPDIELPKTAPIAFESVHFTYPDNVKRATINGLSLTIEHGQKIGIVGHSGAGKTTIVALLLGFYHTTQGTIRLGSYDIRDFGEEQWRSLVSFVPQDTSLFNRTVRENIVYARPDASDAQIQRAIKKAHAKEFIDELPNGLDTIIGERGVKLSGGQRQRIAIARAILRDAPIMILDEATSALDSASEQAIQAALTEAMKGKTVIVVAHRLSTLRHLDKIAVIDKGMLKEFGSHAELLEEKGIYADLWKRQRDGFIVDS